MNTYVCRRFWKPVLVCYIVVIYIAFARIFVGGDFAAYYGNPVFRVPEFVLGMLLGQRQCEKPFEVKAKTPVASIWITLGTCLGIVVLYFAGVVALYETKVWGTDFFKSNYLSYNVIAVPLFAVLIVLLSNLKNGMIPALLSVPVNFLSRLSFYFYLTQTLANRLTSTWIKRAYFGFLIDGDKKILLITLCLNLLFAVLMYLIVEKIIDRALKKIFA